MSLEILPIVATIKKNITTKQVFSLVNCDYTMLNKKSKTFKASVTKDQLDTLIESGYLIDIIEDEPRLDGPYQDVLCDAGTQSISILPTTEPRYQADPPGRGQTLGANHPDHDIDDNLQLWRHTTKSFVLSGFPGDHNVQSAPVSFETNVAEDFSITEVANVTVENDKQDSYYTTTKNYVGFQKGLVGGLRGEDPVEGEVERWVGYFYYFRYFGSYNEDNPNTSFPRAEAIKTIRPNGNTRWTVQYIDYRGNGIWTMYYEQADDWNFYDGTAEGNWLGTNGQLKAANQQLRFAINRIITKSSTREDLQGPFTRHPFVYESNNYYRYFKIDGEPDKSGPVWKYNILANGDHRWTYSSVGNNKLNSLDAFFTQSTHFYPWTNPDWTSNYSDFTTIMRNTNYQETSGDLKTPLPDFADGQYFKDREGHYNGPNNKKFEHVLVSSIEDGTHTYKWTFKDTNDNIIKATGSPIGVIDSANWTSPSANDNLPVSPKVELWEADWTGTALSGTRFITASSMFLEDDANISNPGERNIQNIINETKILPEQQRFNTTWSWDYDGSNVDIVIQEGAVKPDHEEWEDKDGNSRFVRYDWGALYPDGSSEQSKLRASNKYDNKYNSQHATSCAMAAAGKRYGWAKGARIYSLDMWSYTGRSGIPESIRWDVIKRFHLSKPIEEIRPGVMARRPTIVNASWSNIIRSGYFPASIQFGQCTSVMFRNRYITNQELLRRHAGLMKYGISFANGVLLHYRESIARLIDDMTDAGVIFCNSAGNSDNKISIPGELDFNNYATFLAPVYDSYVKTKFYYCRGGLKGKNTITVGAQTFDVQKHLNEPGGTQEPMSYFSTRGPGVDITINGDEVMAAGDGGYNSRWGGTSVSCPGVVGMLALLLDRYPQATPAQLQEFCRTKMFAPQRLMDARYRDDGTVGPESTDPITNPVDDDGDPKYFGTGFNWTDTWFSLMGGLGTIGYIDPQNLDTSFYRQVTALEGHDPGDHYDELETIQPLRTNPENYEPNFDGRLELRDVAVQQRQAGPAPRAFKYYKLVFYRDKDKTMRAGCSNLIGHSQGEHDYASDQDKSQFERNFKNYDTVFNTGGFLPNTLFFYDTNGKNIFGKTPFISGSFHPANDAIKYRDDYVRHPVQGFDYASKRFSRRDEGVIPYPTNWDSTSALLRNRGVYTIGVGESYNIDDINSHGYRTAAGRALYKSRTYSDVASGVMNGYKFFNQDTAIFQAKTKNKETNIGFKLISTALPGYNFQLGRKFCQAYGWKAWNYSVNRDTGWSTDRHFDVQQHISRTWNHMIKLIAGDCAPGSHGWGIFYNTESSKQVKVRLNGFSLGTTSVPTALNVTKTDSVGGNTDAFTDLKFVGTTEGEYIARFNHVIPQTITVEGFTGSSSYANGTYTKQETLINGKSFWNSDTGNNRIEYAGTQWQINDKDEPGTFATLTADTEIPLETGWSLAGTFEGITPEGTPSLTYDVDPYLRRAYKFAKKTSTNTISDGSDTAPLASVGDWVLFIGSQLYNGTTGTLDEMSDIPIVKDYVAVNLDFGNGSSPASIVGFTISTNSTSITDRYPDGINGDYRPFLLSTNGRQLVQNWGATGKSQHSHPLSGGIWDWCHNYKKLIGKLDDMQSDGLREQRHYKELSIKYDYADSRWYILSQKSDGTDPEYLFRTNQYRHPMTPAPSGISENKWADWKRQRSNNYKSEGTPRHWIDMITPTQATDTDINGVSTLTWEVDPRNPYTGSTVGTLSVVSNQDFRSEVFMELDDAVQLGQVTSYLPPLMNSAGGGNVQAIDIFASDTGNYNDYNVHIGGISDLGKSPGSSQYFVPKFYKDKTIDVFPSDVIQNSRVYTEADVERGITYYDIAKGTPIDTRDPEGNYIYMSPIKSGEYSMDLISNEELQAPAVPKTAPSRVSNPRPIHESVGVPNQNLTLSWNHASNFDGYKIFFGTRFDPSTGIPTDTYMTETTDNQITIFAEPTANNTIFRWRVDPFNDNNFFDMIDTPDTIPNSTALSNDGITGTYRANSDFTTWTKTDEPNTYFELQRDTTFIGGDAYSDWVFYYVKPDGTTDTLNSMTFLSTDSNAIKFPYGATWSQAGPGEILLQSENFVNKVIGTTSGKQFQFTTLPAVEDTEDGGAGTIFKRGVLSADPVSAFNPVNNASEQSTDVGKLRWIEPGTRNLVLTGLGYIYE